MLDGARCRKHHVRSVIVGGQIVAEMGALEAAYALGGAEDGSPNRLSGKGRLLEEVEGDVLGRIKRGRDLLQDQVALAGKLGFVEARRHDDVTQDVEGERHVVAHHARIIGGRVDAGRRVQLAAHRLDLLGDILRGPARRSLEGHVLQEMRDAVLAFRFAPAACAHPKPERHGLDFGHGVADHGQAIGKLCLLEAHARTSVRCRGFTPPPPPARAFFVMKSATAP
jgi:hypothetical protein